MEQFTARTATGVLHFIGFSAAQNNTFIHLKTAVLVVNPECTAVFIMVIFSCLVAFHQTSAVSKIAAILVGLPVIFAVNLIRFIIMALLDQYRPLYLTYFPSYLWQGTLLVMVVFMWMAWMTAVGKRETKAALNA